MIHPEIEQRDRLLQGIATATHQLLIEKNYGQAVNLALATLGTAAAADRAYIFENHLAPLSGESLMSQRWEWTAEGIQPEIDNPDLQNLSYDDFFPRWHQTLLRGEIISGPVLTFPDSERQILESQQILSILVIPIQMEQRFWGFIGFDACRTERHWSTSETALLQAAAASLGGRLRQHQTERELDQSRWLLRSVLDNVPQQVYWKDTDLHYLGCNSSAAIANGLERPEEIAGKTEQELSWNPEKTDSHQISDRRVIDSGQPELHMIEPRLQGNGQTEWLGVSRIPLQDDQGKVMGLMVTVTDITARRQAVLQQQQLNEALEAQIEQQTTALQQSETRLCHLTDNVPGMLFEFCQRPDGSRCFPYASVGTQALLNVDPQKLKQDASLAFAEVHPEDLPGLNQSIQASAAGLSDWEYEWRVITPEDYRWLKGFSRPQRQPNGDILWYGYIYNMSDRKQAELLQQQQQQQLKSLLDNIPHLAWLKDQESRFIAVNKPFSHACGTPADDLAGKTDFDIWPAELAQAYSRQDQAVMATRRQQRVEERIVNEQGQTRWFETYKTPVLSTAGMAIGTVGIAVDITDRREAEAALRQSEAKLRQQTQVLEETLQQLRQTQGQMVQSEKMSSLGQLVGGIAHEINNPVSFIYGNICYLQEYADDLMDLIQLYQTAYPEITEPIQAPIQAKIKAMDLAFLQSDLSKILRSIETGAERISEIVRSLSNFSRMDQAGKKAADIHEGLDSTLLILGHRLKIQSNRPEIKVIREYGNLPRLECNPGQLNQVFMNIFSNAIDALETAFLTHSAAAPPLTLTLKVTTGVEQDFATIRIADNGSGMPAEIAAKIYDPFFTTKPLGQGTGFGLAISYQIIVEQHQGKLDCITTPGSGTCFEIRLPLFAAQPQTAARL